MKHLIDMCINFIIKHNIKYDSQILTDECIELIENKKKCKAIIPWTLSLNPNYFRPNSNYNFNQLDMINSDPITQIYARNFAFIRILFNTHKSHIIVQDILDDTKWINFFENH